MTSNTHSPTSTKAERLQLDPICFQGTFADILKLRGLSQDQDAVRFLHLAEEDWDTHGPKIQEDGSQVYSYAEVLHSAKRCADFLRAQGIKRHSKVLLILPTGPAFMSAFLGCQLLGAVPVPAVPPYSMNRLDEYLSRNEKLACTAEAEGLITCQKLVPLFKSASVPAGHAFNKVLSDQDMLSHPGLLEDIVKSHADDIAMIQFTSGSTGNQKGVVLTHANLLANIRAIGEKAELNSEDRCVTWLPLYHDMGLIGHFLFAFVWSMPITLIPPLHFVRRPSSWLKALQKYRGSCCAAPNFAYSLCTKKVKGADFENLDLSSWRVALCGAEPIDPRTIRAFTEKFQEVGFRPSAFFPVYGMAENSLAASFPPPGREPVYDVIDRKLFEATGQAIQAEAGDDPDQVLTCVSVGSAMPRHEIRVCQPGGQPLGEAQMGEIEIRGPSLMREYYKNPEATAEVMREGGWYRTGDLGYTREGELYVTGRVKEMIIKGGRNYFPQDIEAAANQVKGVRVGCSAAFGVWNDKRGTEDLVLVCETRVLGEQDRGELRSQIRKQVQKEVGTSPDKIVLAQVGSVPKTSSGKIQRRLTKKRYLEDDLTPGRKPMLTLARFAVFNVVENLRRKIKGLRSVASIF